MWTKTQSANHVDQADGHAGDVPTIPKSKKLEVPHLSLPYRPSSIMPSFMAFPSTISSTRSGVVVSSAPFSFSQIISSRSVRVRPRNVRLRRWCVRSEKEQVRTSPTAEASPLVKLAWYASESFGNAVAVLRPKAVEDEDGEDSFEGPVDRETVVRLIKEDYDRSYFVTGNMATGIYEKDCEFADPFVSFKGLKRFKQNVSNLGSFMEESSLKLIKWEEYENRIYARWRFNCVLALPWRPILAATGSTEYYFSEGTGKISKHVETWDISPADGVRQLFKANPRPKKENV